MHTLSQFDPPANVQDLSDPKLAAQLRAEWSASLNRSTETAILGDPWDVLNDSNRIYYYNPLRTNLSNGTSAPIRWIAFPNRILLNFGNASTAQQWGYAEGVHTDGTFGPPPPVSGRAYGPPGPRGWQDEYCEWITTRDSNGNITRIDFTCENPEYWFSLWRKSPETVLSWYRKLVDPSVQLEDLFLLDENGETVIERETARPAYNPTNKWNNQPSAGQVTGAVHLISPPNTLGAEIYLAAAATLLRDNPPGTPVTDPNALINCSRYGQPGRNSDPHIGASVNGLIPRQGNSTVVSLQNPVGLYIQMPNFSGFQLPSDPKLPAGATVADCWNIVRGSLTLPGEDPTFNFILHARFEIPQAWKDAGVSFTVSDITILGDNIQFGAQITQQFQIGLRGLALGSTLPLEKPLTCQAPNPNPLPAPQQLQDSNLFNAGSTSNEVCKVEQGSTTPNIVLAAGNVPANRVSIQFSGTGVTASAPTFVTLPGGQQAALLTITVDQNAPLGDRSILLTAPDGTHGPSAPGLLTVVPPGSLRQVAPAHLGALAAVAPGNLGSVAKMVSRKNRQRRHY